ncbi:MAG: hypothetical protein HQK60_12800 [Deltaproteobacteria bacterium]|nr:hypothetical protein [Deltaproteobacteria bacterium]
MPDVLTCDICGFVAKSKPGLGKHKSRHAQEQPGSDAAPQPMPEEAGLSSEGETPTPERPARKRAGKAKKRYAKLTVSHILEIIDTWERGSNTVETLAKKYNVSVGEIHRAIGMLRKAAMKPEGEAVPAFLCPITLEEVVRAALAQRGMKLSE